MSDPESDEEVIEELTEKFPANTVKAKIKRNPELRKNTIPSRQDEIVPVSKKIIKGKIVRKKRVQKKGLLESWLGEDAKNVGAYVFTDVLLPALKSVITEMVSTGIEMLVYGESKGSPRRGGRPGSNKSVVSYGNFYQNNARPSQGISHRKRNTQEDIILENRAEAEQVLETILTLLDDYGEVSMADVYDLVGIESAWTDNNYGWENLSKAGISRVREGYLLNLPRAIALSD